MILRTSSFLALMVLTILGLVSLDLRLQATVRPTRPLATSTVQLSASLTPLSSATPTRLPSITAPAAPSPTPTPTNTATSTASPTYPPTPSLYPPDLATAPAYLDNTWQTMPVIPEIDGSLRDHLQAIYARGQVFGNSPKAFSKVGDCNTASEFFLIPFDTPEAYQLGDYAYLQTAIDNFHGSFARNSLAALTGFGPSAMFDPTWTDPARCGRDEGPLPCEFRLHRPSLVLIGLGTHNLPQTKFESQLRRVIEYSLEQGVIPILATKVDTEGGDRVNALIVWLANQYRVPLG